MSMNKRRSSGEGTIDERGPGAYRIRYRVDGRRHAVTVRGTYADAKRKLRELLRAVDTNTHVAPDRTTLAQWADEWLALHDGRPGTLQRYRHVLDNQVLGVLGGRPLQAIRGTEIGMLYRGLAEKLAPRSIHLVHRVCRALFREAVRRRLLVRSPIEDIKAPKADETSIGKALDADQLSQLVKGFEGHPLYPVVCLCALAGLRRGEALGLKWTDLDTKARTLHVRRSVEHTAELGVILGQPKTARSLRKIAIGDDLIAVLLAEQRKYLRIAAGVGDAESAGIDLSMIRLEADALMFPAPASPFSFTKLRTPEAVSKAFSSHAARLGFPDLRLHDLRHTHGTALLDAGVPVHTAAHRMGHSPKVLLQIYAHHTEKGDEAAAAAVASISKGIIGGRS
jgi:integrase